MPRRASNIAAVGSSQVPSAVRSPPPAQALEQTQDRAANQAQQNARAAYAPAASSPLAAPNIIRGVSFAANAPTPVQHKLGKKYTSCHPVAIHASSPPSWCIDPTQGGQDPKKTGFLDAAQVTLIFSTACTADIAVYP